MSGASSSRATELEVSSEEVDGGLTLPRVSSARQRYVSVRMGQRTNNRLGSKSQPEINRRKNPRIASKLCSTMPQPNAIEAFELYNARKSYPFLEYNGLHDPHLKSYFYRSQMKDKLIKTGFVTRDMYVLCRSLKDFNALRNFQQSELMKEGRDALIEKDRKERAIASVPLPKRRINVEREEKRKKFHKQQQEKLYAQEAHMHKKNKQAYSAKMKALEERQKQREKIDMERNAERQQRELKQLREEFEDDRQRRAALDQFEENERLRHIYLTRMREEEKMRRLNELEKCWQKYDVHTRQVKEEEEAQKAWDMEEREKRIRRREEFLLVLRKKDEELRAKLHEENKQQAEQLKEKADYLENRRQITIENERFKWKESFQRKQEKWNHSVSQQREAMKKRKEKHLEELLKHNNLPSVTTRPNRTFRKFGCSSRPVTTEKSHPPQSTTVRFTAKPTVHFIETSIPDESAMEDGGMISDNKLIYEQEEACPLEGGGANTSKRANTADLDHKDSYDIHLEKSRKWSKTESDGIKQRNSMDLSPVLDETGCAGSKKILVRDDVSLLSHDVSLLSQQKSTASDLIGCVLHG